MRRTIAACLAAVLAAGCGGDGKKAPVPQPQTPDPPKPNPKFDPKTEKAPGYS